MRTVLTACLMLPCLCLVAPAAGAADPQEVAEPGRPIRVLLVIGGCCHDYEGQKKALTNGISARAKVEWTVIHEGDGKTTHKHSIFSQPEWWKGFDVVLHDECTADVKERDFVDGILKPHRDGLPAVLLHCAMHCYRVPNSEEWFKFAGLTSTGHGPQQPIEITLLPTNHPITRGLENWTTIREELYNNVKLWETATPLARGKQGRAEYVVAWTNLYNGKTRVFATTLGHNTATVADPRYLDLVTRGLLWAVDRLDDRHLGAGREPVGDAAAEVRAGDAAAVQVGDGVNPILANLLDGEGVTPEKISGIRSIALSNGEPPHVRARAIRELAGGDREPEALEAVVEALASVLAAETPHPELVGVLDEFARDPGHAANIAFFAKLGESPSSAKRELGYAVLVNLAGNELIKAGERAAAEKAIDRGWSKPAWSASLLRAIGRTRAEGYNDWIEAMLTDPSADVVRAAGFAADRLGLKHDGPDPESRVAIEKLAYERVLELVGQEKGDPTLGAELFSRQGCIACHTVSAGEPPKGPFLGGIGSRYSGAELAESILKPSARIAEGFETHWFRTRDGDELDGFIVREGADEVEIRNAAGISSVIAIGDVRSRGQRKESMMPEGLVNPLTPRELAAIVAYLGSLPGE